MASVKTASARMASAATVIPAQLRSAEAPRSPRNSGMGAAEHGRRKKRRVAVAASAEPQPIDEERAE